MLNAPRCFSNGLNYQFAIINRFSLSLNHQKHNDMILTTTPQIEGSKISAYLGIVTGETIIGANFIKDFTASISDFFGGRSDAYERVLREAKETAMREMEDEAKRMGADAVVGIDLDYETVGSRGMLMVAVSGTAVRL